MDANLLEQLLNENESTSLDFKQEQYEFAGADDSIKSELLKDILAFANAWRRTDAYILIGVEEVKGGRSNVVGVDSHLDDHSLQQFVNSKTQRPITFSYISFAYEGKQIGIIWIPDQTRPIYLRKDYGKLQQNLVYIRRGSSTDIALPDEVARMGSATGSQLDQHSLSLKFADIYMREFLGNSIELTSTALNLPDYDNIPDFKPNAGNPFDTTSLLRQPNPNYYRKLALYFHDKFLINPIGFGVENLASITAYNVRMLITVEQEPSLKLLAAADYPALPKKYHSSFSNASPDITPLHTLLEPEQKMDLDFHSNRWTLNVGFGNVQPKAKSWSNDIIYIGFKEEKSFELKGQLFADNLPDPIEVPLTISFTTKDFTTDIDALNELMEKELQEIRDGFNYDDQ